MFREGTPTTRYCSDMEKRQDLIGGDQRTRARAIVVPEWWLALANRLAANDKRGLVDLGKRLATAIKRDQPFNHGTISKFLRGKTLTDELVAAFVTLFDMPQPAYYPRDLAEAIVLKAAIAAPATSEPPPPRLKLLDDEADQLSSEVIKSSPHHGRSSVNDTRSGGTRDKRHGGMGPRRSPSKRG